MIIKYKVKKERVFYLLAILALGLVLFGNPITVLADDVMVEEKIIVNAPVKAVWALVGGFGVLDRWHPAVITSTLLGTGKEVGDIRVLALNEKLTVTEKLEYYDEDAMTFQYQILESPLPIENYHATIIVSNKENGMTEIVWKSSFNAAGVSNEEAKKIISDIYLAGFETLNNLYK